MNKHLYFFVIAVGVICFLATAGCKKREPESPFTSQLPDFDSSVVTVEAPEEETMNVEVVESPSSMSAPELPVPEVSSGVFIAPTLEEVQTALKNAGYYKGNIDGKIGPKSKEAICEFQRDNNLTVDGKVGRMTWAKLKSYLNQAVSR